MLPFCISQQCSTFFKNHYLFGMIVFWQGKVSWRVNWGYYGTKTRKREITHWDVSTPAVCTRFIMSSQSRYLKIESFIWRSCVSPSLRWSSYNSIFIRSSTDKWLFHIFTFIPEDCYKTYYKAKLNILQRNWVTPRQEPFKTRGRKWLIKWIRKAIGLRKNR